MASRNGTLKRPHFFKFIYEEYPGKRLWIPRRFMKVYGGEISSRVKVQDPKGRRWILDLAESDGEFWFQNGWKELADYYSLENGHLLVFKYLGNSCFSLVILDKTSTEIEYDPIKRTGGNVQKIKRVAIEKSGVTSIDASAPSLLKKTKESSAKYVSRPAKMIMRKNPVEDFQGSSHRRKEAEQNGRKRDSDLIAEVEVPDSDFKDFEEDRQKRCFKIGQVWAIYDPLDDMPRWYARISNVFVHGKFEVKVTWLEAQPDNEDTVKRIERGLPSPSCGTFKHGKAGSLDRRMFSHLMFYENGGGRNTYRIFPRKGETWAVFKNEYTNWKSDSSMDFSGYFEYEVVEVLSEYKEGVGVMVAYLSKVMGFVSIFCRVGNNCFIIADDDLYRFSHKVSSLKLIGSDKYCVPDGAFELDPGALP